jgi:hypothetical protein
MSEPVRLVLLDNEPAQALTAVRHPKHRTVIAHLEAALDRGGTRHARPRVRIPAAVRVEAGIDRTTPTAATFNRARVADVPLDQHLADVAASINHAHAVGVADAHLTAVAVSAASPVLVLTSDPGDITRAAAQHPDVVVRLV